MRPTKDEYFLLMAKLVATRGTCPRRQVGCVLVGKNSHVLSTGYNGPPRDLPHCTDHPCPGATSHTGDGLDKCQATHAEQNALLQCPDVEDIHTVYTTTSPCIHCLKLLMNTGATRIVFISEYSDTRPRDMWLRLHPTESWVAGPDALRTWIGNRQG